MVFTTGLLIQYPPSLLLLAPVSGSDLASKLVPGMRLPDFRDLNQADGVPCYMHHVSIADGRWRVLVFAGDISIPTLFTRLQRFGEHIAAKESFLTRVAGPDEAIDSRIEVITIHAAKRSNVELLELHNIFHPWSEETGWDYWKVYADDEDVHGNKPDAYSRCGVSSNSSCIVVVRPDGYVSLVCALDELATVEDFFAGFMLQPEHH